MSTPAPAVRSWRRRFSHLISIDFFGDLLAVLKALAQSRILDVAGGFQCVLTTLQLASGQGRFERAGVEGPRTKNRPLSYVELRAPRRPVRARVPSGRGR